MRNCFNELTKKATNEALKTFINSLHEQLEDKLSDMTAGDEDYDYLNGADDLLKKIEDFINETLDS